MNSRSARNWRPRQTAPWRHRGPRAQCRRKHLVEVPVERQHLSVQPVERAQTEGAVLLQLGDGDHSAVDTFHQRGRGGDLEQCRMIDLEGVGQEAMTMRATGSPVCLLRACNARQCFRDVTRECGHDGSAPVVQTRCSPANTVNETSAASGPDRKVVLQHEKRGISAGPTVVRAAEIPR